MARYLMIESRDPLESGDVPYYYDLAHGLLREGHEVVLFLVQNGVLPARKSPQSARLLEIAKAGVKIFADDFSLRERGITMESLISSVSPSAIDRVVDLLADGATRAMWH